MLIDGLLEDGETERCLKQLKAMEENGFEPNVKTYMAMMGIYPSNSIPESYGS